MTTREITWNEVELFAEHCAVFVEEQKLIPDLVYGIPRGGIIPAQMIAQRLGVNLLPLGNLPTDLKPGMRVLVVDDIIDSGATVKHYLSRLGPSAAGVVALASKGSKSYVGGNMIPVFSPAPFPEDVWIAFPWEEQGVAEDNAGHIRRVLEILGEDPTRPGLVDTPKRFLKAMQEMTSGYEMKAEDIFKATFTDPDIDQLVVIPRIEFYSTCEHHLFPFYGHVHIGYLPRGRVLGISKFARLVRMYSRRLQIQESMTHQICSAITEHLDPAGVGVVVEARHLCMSSRGAESRDNTFVTSSMQGVIRDYARSEFLALAGLGQGRPGG